MDKTLGDYAYDQNCSTEGYAYNSALIKAGKCLFAFADITNDMIQVSDCEGRIQYANQATETMLGYQPDEMLNSLLFEFVHPDDRQSLKNEMLLISTDNQFPVRESRLVKKDGTFVDVEIKGALLNIDDNISIGLTIRDISRRKELERELADCRNKIQLLVEEIRKESEKELADYRKSLERLVDERTQKLAKALDEIKSLKGSIAICMHCKDVRDDDGEWNQVEEFLNERSSVMFTHGICPDCEDKHYSKMKIATCLANIIKR